MMVDLIVENGRIHRRPAGIRMTGRTTEPVSRSARLTVAEPVRQEGTGMNAKVRMWAVPAAVIAALAGCGSQAPGVHPMLARQACPEGSAYPAGTHGEADYTDTTWHGSVSYEYRPWRRYRTR